jgi:two-component system, OmpR family, sensor kinase
MSAEKRPPDPDAALVRRTRLRLGVQTAGIVSVIVVILTTTAVLVVLAAQRAQANTLLDQAIVRAIDVLDPPADVWVVIRSEKGLVQTTPGLPAGVGDTGALLRTANTGVPEAFDRHLGGAEYRIQTIRRADGVTVEGILDLGTNHAERDRLVAAMLTAGAVGLLLAGAFGAWLGARATRPLTNALALQRRFVRDASHELRTPLTLLSTRAQLLRRRLRADHAEPEVLDAAHHVVTDAERLAAILDDLLLAADPTTQQPRVQVDLAALAADVVAETPPAPDAPIQLIGPQPARDPHLAATTVRGSPIALRRAITALVDNAVRHARHTVQVSVRHDHHHAILEVADDGPGVDPEIAPRIFQRFASAGGRDPDGRRHYGLGLALVSEIAALHGGQVELAASQRSGAILRIVLPSAPHG